MPRSQRWPKRSRRRGAAAFDDFEFSKALEAIWALISRLDRYIVQQAALEAGASQADASAEPARHHALHRGRSLRIVTALV